VTEAARVCFSHLDNVPRRRHLSRVVVYAVVDDSLSPTSPLGDSIDVFVRREDAERFGEEIRGGEPRERPSRGRSVVLQLGHAGL
jgi:hypothetical protein